MSDASEPIDAATVVVARDSADGVEVLMLRRNSKIYFGGMWAVSYTHLTLPTKA